LRLSGSGIGRAGASVEYDAFLSYNRRDTGQALWLAQELRNRGLRVFLDAAELVPGRDWDERLKGVLSTASSCVVCVGESGFGPVQEREIRFAIEQYNLRSPHFGLVPVFLPGAKAGASLGPLDRFHWIDLTTRSPQKLGELVAATKGLAPGFSEFERMATEVVNPYQGLKPFSESASRFFFGREVETGALMALIDQRRFVALVGASGSGKSSLVHAGVLPALRKRTDPPFAILPLRPGPDPFGALAEACASSLSPGLAPSEFEREVAGLSSSIDPMRGGILASLERILARVLAGAGPNARGLIVIDQFEELYLLVEDPRVREVFSASLARLIEDTRGAWSVLLTLRADQYELVVRDQVFGPLIASSQLSLRAMGPEALLKAITGPANLTGLALEPGLAEKILEDMQGETDALPLLEFLLDQLWQDRDRRRNMLVHDGYLKAGGVRHAIAQHAGQVFAGLSAAEQRIAHDLLVRLVRPGRGTPDSKRPLPVAHLSIEEQHLAGKLSDERLLVYHRDTVELAHEALISAWSQLKDWVDSERTDLLAKERLEEDALLWQGLTKANPAEAKKRLLDKEWRLPEAESLRSRKPKLFQDAPMLVAFIEASSAAVKAAEQTERRAIAARERARQRWTWVVASVALCIAFYFWYLQNQKEKGWEAAIGMSRVLGVTVPETLSTKNGVPPDALAKVLQGASAKVKEMAGPDDKQQATLIDIGINTAHSAFSAGDYAQSQSALDETESLIKSFCADKPDWPDCLLRAAELKSVAMQMSYWRIPRTDASALKIQGIRHAYELAGEIVKMLPDSAAAALSDAESRWLWALTRENARILKARIEFNRDLVDEKTPAIPYSQVIEEMDVCAGAITGLADREGAAKLAAVLAQKPTAVGEAALRVNEIKAGLVWANCQRVKSDILRALDPPKLKDAQTTLNAAKEVLRKLKEADTADVGVQQLLSLTEQRALVNDFKTPAANADPKTLARKREEYDKMREAFDALVLENGRNFQLQNFYLYYVGTLAENQDTYLPAKVRADIYRTMLKIEAARVRALKTQSAGPAAEAERRARTSHFLAILRYLYQQYDSTDPEVGGRRDLILDLHKDFGSLVSLDEFKDDASYEDLLNAGLILEWGGDAYRREGDEEAAIVQYFAIARSFWNRTVPAQDANLSEEDKERRALVWYFRSGSVADLGKIDASKITEKPHANELLKKVADFIEAKWAQDQSNQEFRLAKANLLYQLGAYAFSEKRERDAADLFERAAQFGSSDAALQLRDWYLNGSGPVGRDESKAALYGRRSHDREVVRDEIVGRSSIYTNEQQPFTVYLTPGLASQDVVGAEIARLKTYYGFEAAKTESEERLRRIMKRAAEFGGNSPEITRQHILRARAELSESDNQAFLLGGLGIDEVIARIGPLIDDKNFGHALDEIEHAVKDLDKAVAAGTLSREKQLRAFGFLAKTYARLADAARRADNRDIAGRAADAALALNKKIADVAQQLGSTARASDDPILLEALRVLAGEAEASYAMIGDKKIQDQQILNRLSIGELWQSVAAGLDEARVILLLQVLREEKGPQTGVLLKLASAYDDKADLYTRNPMGIELIEAAEAAVGQALRLAPGSVPIKLESLGLLIRHAKFHQGLGELDAGLRVAERAVSEAKDLVGKNPNDFAVRLKYVEAREALGGLRAARAFSIANTYKATKDQNHYGDEWLKKTWTEISTEFHKAKDQYNEANNDRKNLLRVGSIEGLDALIENIRRLVSIEEVLQYDKPEKNSVILRYLDGEIATLDRQIGCTTASGANNESRNFSDDEVLYRFYAAKVLVIKAEFRLQNDGADVDVRDEFTKAAGCIAPLSQRYFEDVDQAYGIILGDLAYSLIVKKDPAKAKVHGEAAFDLARTLPIDKSLDIYANYAHALAVTGDFARAREIYLSPIYSLYYFASDDKRGWATQIKSDLMQLIRIYPEYRTSFEEVIGQLSKSR